MYHIVYTSSVVGATSEDDLKEILFKSRAKNARHLITGMLLLSGNQWMQVLEGNQEDVATIFNAIARDPRHTNVCKLADGYIKQRAFSEWSMGFTTASSEEYERLVGYFNPNSSDFLAKGVVQPKDEVFSLLKEFCLEREELL
jgi:hypothetical protein